MNPITLVVPLLMAGFGYRPFVEEPNILRHLGLIEQE